VVTPEQAVAARDALLACDAIGFRYRIQADLYAR
jgi:hypothetical protein